MKIETLPTAKLIPYSRNARTHSEVQVAQIAASIREFGFTNPVLIDAENGIIAGHGRVLGAQLLGMDKVPCIRLAHLSDTQRRAYLLADNKLAMNAGWDEAMLALELTGLRELDFDLGLIGFDETELADLLAETTEGLTDPDEVPEPPADPVSVPGDVWILGNHRIVCGDCTDPLVVKKLMRGSIADMLLTDPPYNVEYEGNYIRSGKILKKSDKIWSGGIANDNISNFADWLKLAFFVSGTAIKDGAAIYIWHPSGEDCKFFWLAWPFDEWHFQVDLVWNKTSLIISRWDYKPQHEPCMYGWKGKNRSWIGPNNEPTVWDIPRQRGKSGEKREHPTQKPTECMSRAMGNHDAALVFDPFLGSGTTLIAAEQLGRACYGMEIDPQYCDVIITRWQAFSGKQAIHEATGKTFDSMKK